MMGTLTTGTIEKYPDRHVLDATHLTWLIGAYLKALRLRVDPHTVECQDTNLRWFTDWWEEEGSSREWQLSKEDLILFEKYLREVVSKRTKRKLAYNTRKTVLRRLREAFKWAHDNGYTERNYAFWMPTAWGVAPKRKAATIDMLAELLKAASYGHMGGRDRALIALLIGTGMRRAEASNLNVKDIHFEPDNSGYAEVVGKRTRAKPEGKREVAFDAATGTILAEYMMAYDMTRGALFRGQGSDRLTPQGIYKVVKRIIAEAGLEDKIIGCHDLRRAFATQMARDVDGKASAKLLAEQLGHTSYNTTMIYINPNIDDVRRVLVSPVSKMRLSRDPDVQHDIGLIRKDALQPSPTDMEPVSRAELLGRLLGDDHHE